MNGGVAPVTTGSALPAPLGGGHGLVDHGRERLRRDVLDIAAQALAAVDPATALRARLRFEDDTLWIGDEAVDLAGRRLVVLGAGKATIGMAAVVDEVLGARIGAGAVVVKKGQGRRLEHLEVLEAAHPVPDAASLVAGERLLALAREARPDDLVIALVTGGSSALAVVPADGVSLDDKIAVNRLLLGCGADIVEINNVRKHISAIKGGLLGAACGCEIVNISVSDVVGDPPDYFTDLTVADRSTFAMAQAVCDRYDLWARLPAGVARRLRAADPAQETPKAIDRVRIVVVASATIMCEAAAAAARDLGYEARVTTLELEGEAAAAGRHLALELQAAPPRTALICGGENTVTLPAGRLAGDRRSGDGGAYGGPSQEASLAAALELGTAAPGAGASCLLCLDSDGTDGPTDAAGGLVDDLSARAAREGGVDLDAALARHASHDALLALGDLVVTGPTGTNVNDLKIGLRG